MMQGNTNLAISSSDDNSASSTLPKATEAFEPISAVSILALKRINAKVMNKMKAYEHNGYGWKIVVINGTRDGDISPFL
jgi:hypothetical protein